MGMSSSQARLLNLTSRMHQIEYKAAKLEAEKLQMANESNRVYEDYLNALEKQKINVNVLGTDAAITHKDLTADMIYNFGSLSAQYALVTNDDKTLISSSLHTTYKNTNSLSDFLTALGMDETYTQTVHHSEINPAYETALSNYNNDHSNWITNNTAYVQYQNDLANYDTNHAEWVTKNTAYTQYQTELNQYNIDHAAWVTQTSAYAQYQVDLANYNRDHAAWENAADNYSNYQTEHAQWVTDHAAWVTRKNAYDTYLTQKATHDTWAANKAQYDQYLTNKAYYDQWVTENPEDVKEDKNQVWWTVLETGVGREGLDTDFVTAASKTCYGVAKTAPSCYAHVLIHMLDFDGTNISHQGYTTTLGYEAKYTNTYAGGCHNQAMTDVNGNETNTNVIFKEVSDVANSGVMVNTLGETCDINSSSSDYEKLLSKFNVDGSAKSLKQWVIDLLYITQHTSSSNLVAGYPLKDDGTPDNATFGATIDNIQSSLANSLYNFNEVVYNQAVTDWTNRGIPEPTPVADPGAEPPLIVAPAPGAEPIEPTYVPAPTTEPTEPAVVAAPGPEPTEPTRVPAPGAEPVRPTAVANPGAEPQLADYIAGIDKTIEWDEEVTHSTFADKDLAQWYVNVWCKMEGFKETPMVTEVVVHDDATNTNKAIYSVQNINKSITTYGTNPFSNTVENDNYIVISDDKLNDNTWISNTVQNGMVMIQVWDKSSSAFVDTSVATNTGLNYVDDSIELKKAEAKYEADMKKIDLKDRKYDSYLAALDAERNAIKSEMETLKTVAKENVDRTFKLFS